MEKRLKKQRNRLFLRIILIMLVIWLAVSAVFCAARINSEKVNAQTKELSNLSQVKKLLTVGDGSFEAFNQVFEDNFDFSVNSAFDSQLLFTNRSTKEVIADTANSITLSFVAHQGADSNIVFTSLLDYDLVREPLSDEQFEEIKRLLNTKNEDGSYYELTCTKLQAALTVIPLELTVVQVDGKDSRFVVDDRVAVYDLSKNALPELESFEGSKVRRNVIPKDFLLNEKYNRDLIGGLSKEQTDRTVDFIGQGGFNYLFYTSDYLTYVVHEEGVPNAAWRIQYAKKINILDSCKTDLAITSALIFGFFLTIAVILCVMIWHTVKAQIIQEQKRLDLTNALAHDIKTPLFVISGYAYSLKEDIDENERELYIDKIIEQTDEVNSLVHRMLNFSKLDSYSMTLHKEDFDLCALTEELLQNYASLPNGKKLSFTHSGDNTVNADKELIKTVLQNLIDNAAKYSLPDSEIKAEVKDKSFSIGNAAEGITKADLKNIWKPYVRKDKSRHQKGNGLGLSIVKSVLDLHEAKCETSLERSVLTIRFTL